VEGLLLQPREVCPTSLRVLQFRFDVWFFLGRVRFGVSCMFRDYVISALLGLLLGAYVMGWAVLP
jgi:hypothetical protein